jgi:hypothetical protein
MHLVPLLLLAAEGKCEIQLLLQYSPEMWQGFLNPIIFIWEFEFKCPHKLEELLRVKRKQNRFRVSEICGILLGLEAFHTVSTFSWIC